MIRKTYLKANLTWKNEHRRLESIIEEENSSIYLPSHKSMMPFEDAKIRMLVQLNTLIRRLPCLWWVFRTQGKADAMETPTIIFVKTPMASTATWLFLWRMRIVATPKINQRNPDVAHPEWIPPRCWRTEVHANRNERGVHCINVIKNVKRILRHAHFGEKGVYKQI